MNCAELDRTFVLAIEPGIWACEPGRMEEVLPLIEAPLLQEGEHEIRVLRDDGYHLLLGEHDIEGERLGSPLSSLSLSFTLVRSSRDDAQERFVWMREALSIHGADEEEPRVSYRLSQHRQMFTSACRSPPCSEFPECEWQAEAALK